MYSVLQVLGCARTSKRHMLNKKNIVAGYRVPKHYAMCFMWFK